MHATVDDQLISHVVGEVFEVGLDEARFSSVYDLKVSGWKLKAFLKK
jgi:hypothetical protein